MQFSTLLNRFKSRRIQRYEHNLLRDYKMASPTCIALGYAHKSDGVGGVRNHLMSINKFSKMEIKLFPDENLSTWAAQSGRRKEIDQALCGLPLKNYLLLHSHVDPGFVQACEAAHWKGTPWVHTYHTLYFPEDWGGQLQPWQEEINNTLIKNASRADVRITISRWLHDLLESEYGIASEVIPNGVDLEKCMAADPDGVSVKLDGPYVLFSGSSRSVKNPELFIDLAARIPELTFVMIGEGLIVELQAKFYQKPLPSNLKLLGPVPHEMALAYTKGASSLVVTSHSEGLPTAVMEAMAMGTPVVVPDSFGCRDLVCHAKTGFLYEPGEIDDLEDSLLKSLRDDQVGPSAMDYIENNYAWPVVAEKLDRMYESLING